MKTNAQQWLTAYTWSQKMVMQFGVVEGKEFSEYLAINCNNQQIRQLYAMVYLILCMENELISNPHLKSQTHDAI